MRFFQYVDYGISIELITPASADVKRGAFFALAKKVTLFTVSCMQLLDEAAIAEKKSSPSAEKSVTLFSLIIINRVT